MKNTNGLRETLEKLSLFRWQSTTEKEAEEKIEEYLKSYPHLRNPACIDLLREAVHIWQQIRHLETLQSQAVGVKEQAMIINKIERLTRTWIQMIANLGLSFTKQPYIGKKTQPVRPPEELFKMMKGKEKKNGKTETV